jgi:hypothetical protein
LLYSLKQTLLYIWKVVILINVVNKAIITLSDNVKLFLKNLVKVKEALINLNELNHNDNPTLTLKKLYTSLTTKEA